jgi:hypothetical protein
MIAPRLRMSGPTHLLHCVPLSCEQDKFDFTFGRQSAVFLYYKSKINISKECI